MSVQPVLQIGLCGLLGATALFGGSTPATRVLRKECQLRCGRPPPQVLDEFIRERRAVFGAAEAVVS